MLVTVTTLTGIHSLKQILFVVNIGVYIQLTKFSIVIGSLHAYLPHNPCRITWVPKYNLFYPDACNSPVSYFRPRWAELRKTHQSEANAGKKWVDESSRTGEASRKRKMLQNIPN